ncbi:hypothetical protein S83_037315 [Arachis hypogaea]
MGKRVISNWSNCCRSKHRSPRPPWLRFVRNWRSNSGNSTLRNINFPNSKKKTPNLRFLKLPKFSILTQNSPIPLSHHCNDSKASKDTYTHNKECLMTYYCC